jgi:hypothetical protein
VREHPQGVGLRQPSGDRSVDPAAGDESALQSGVRAAALSGKRLHLIVGQAPPRLQELKEICINYLVEGCSC